jgi:hypothetical protein
MPSPQHQVRKVHVPRVRRHIGALGHVAKVAEITLVYDLPVVLALDPVELARLAFIDEIEQRGKGGAQTYAAATTVADVEDAMQFAIQLLFIKKFW